MQHNDSALHQVSAPGWQLLGEIELTVNPDSDRTVGKWLTVILSALNPHADFINKVLRSAEEAAARAMQSGAVMKYQHTHLLIYVPTDRPAGRQTWGFFRIEKMAAQVEDQTRLDHDIEFYLYLEG